MLIEHAFYIDSTLDKHRSIYETRVYSVVYFVCLCLCLLL